MLDSLKTHTYGLTRDIGDIRITAQALTGTFQIVNSAFFSTTQPDQVNRALSAAA